MPKIIEKLSDTAVQVARRDLLTLGYEGMNLRSIAKQCGVAVGTLYNYFPSKEVLTAHVMLEDWQVAVSNMWAGCESASDVVEGCRAIFSEIRVFCELYRAAWSGYARHNALQGFGERHRMLREQITEILKGLFQLQNIDPGPFAAEFTTESLLWAAQDESTEFSDVERILKQYLR